MTRKLGVTDENHYRQRDKRQTIFYESALIRDEDYAATGRGERNKLKNRFNRESSYLNTLRPLQV